MIIVFLTYVFLKSIERFCYARFFNRLFNVSFCALVIDDDSLKKNLLNYYYLLYRHQQVLQQQSAYICKLFISFLVSLLKTPFVCSSFYK